MTSSLNKLTLSSSLYNSTVEFFIGKEKDRFTLYRVFLHERAPFILSHTVNWINWDMHGGSQAAYLETEDLLTFNAFKNWLYNDYTRGFAYGEDMVEPGGPGALWSFAARWHIDELQNICMDHITYAFFVEPRHMKITSTMINQLLDVDRHGKMRKFLMMVCVRGCKLMRKNPTLSRHPVLHSTFQTEVVQYWNATFEPTFKSYVYNCLDFHV
ncbi:hypothetical protein MMC15_006403 [Xylographa vitiligo]|nr:hypothetical protein [Xylographa vitiligo]